MASLFPYLPLSDSQREIRLLKLLPGSWETVIKCDLETFPLNEAPDYEALSYVWGDPEMTYPIHVNGELFNVTENLWFALRRLRQQESRTLWIDAICINQNDRTEKTHQVTLMGQIYKRCKQAVLWLGEDVHSLRVDHPSKSPTALYAFMLLAILSTDDHLDTLPCFSRDENGDIMVDEEISPVLSAVLHVMDLSWWSRIWIVQEAVLPPKATLMYSSESLDFQVIISACKRLREHVSRCCQLGVIDPSSGHTTLMMDLTRRFQETVQRFETISRWHHSGSAELSLMSIRRLFCAQKATDSRDLIFALLGLVEGGPPYLAPDYTISPEEVFTAVAIKFIDFQQNLHCLEGSRTRGRPGPSWIPDWICIAVDPTTSVRDASLFLQIQASKGYWVQPILSRSLQFFHLEVTSFEVDSVTVLGEVLSAINASQIWSSWMHLAGIDLLPPELGPEDKDSVVDMFWRMLISNSSAFKHEPTIRKADFSDYDSFFDIVTRISGGDIRAMMTLIPLSLNKRMFITKGGLLGLGPESLLEGDQVHILIGARYPFLLRPVAEQNEGEIPKFTVIQECYLHGVMHGEGLEGDWEEKTKRIALC